MARKVLTFDPTTGKISIDQNISKILNNSDAFGVWAGTILGNFIGSKLPKGVVNLVNDYLSGKITPATIQENFAKGIADTLDNFLKLGKDNIFDISWEGFIDFA